MIDPPPSFALEMAFPTTITSLGESLPAENNRVSAITLDSFDIKWVCSIVMYMYYIHIRLCERDQQ